MIGRKTIIQPRLLEEAEEIYEYIKQDSLKNANKFREELLSQIDKIELNPNFYTPEPILSGKRNLYKFILVMKSWKLIFKVTKEYLVFVSLFHTSRNPSEIKKLRTTDY